MILHLISERVGAVLNYVYIFHNLMFYKSLFKVVK